MVSEVGEITTVIWSEALKTTPDTTIDGIDQGERRTSALDQATLYKKFESNDTDHY